MAEPPSSSWPPEDEAGDSEQVRANREVFAAITLALRGLSPLESTVVSAVYRDGAARAAVQLGLTETRVRNVYKMGMRKLRGKRSVSDRIKLRRITALKVLTPLHSKGGRVPRKAGRVVLPALDLPPAPSYAVRLVIANATSEGEMWNQQLRNASPTR
jgi:hypothetical protein